MVQLKIGKYHMKLVFLAEISYINYLTLLASITFALHADRNH